MGGGGTPFAGKNAKIINLIFEPFPYLVLNWYSVPWLGTFEKCALNYNIIEVWLSQAMQVIIGVNF